MMSDIRFFADTGNHNRSRHGKQGELPTRLKPHVGKESARCRERSLHLPVSTERNCSPQPIILSDIFPKQCLSDAIQGENKLPPACRQVAAGLRQACCKPRQGDYQRKRAASLGADKWKTSHRQVPKTAFRQNRVCPVDPAPPFPCRAGGAGTVGAQKRESSFLPRFFGPLGVRCWLRRKRNRTIVAWFHWRSSRLGLIPKSQNSVRDFIRQAPFQLRSQFWSWC